MQFVSFSQGKTYSGNAFTFQIYNKSCNKGVVALRGESDCFQSFLQEDKCNYVCSAYRGNLSIFKDFLLQPNSEKSKM